MSINLETIKELVEIETGLKDIANKERTQEYVNARVIFYVLGKDKAKCSYTKLGKFLDKNHATVLHSYKVIYQQWKNQPQYFTKSLESLRTIEDMITKDLDTLKKENATKELFYNYQRRNALLRKEVKALKEIIDKNTKEIKRLKQYEPIW